MITEPAIRSLWRSRWRLLLMFVVGGLLGATAATLTPKTYVSELNLRVGRSFGQDTEDSFALAKFLESEAFRASVSRRFGSPVAKRQIRATVIEGGVGPKAAVAYIEVRTSARTPTGAHRLAELVLEGVLERHAPLFEASVREYSAYQATLARQIEEVRAEIERMGATMEVIRRNPSVTAPAVMLLQGQVETRQTQLLGFARELRDSRIQQAVNTRATAALGPPSTPERPDWPSRSLFAASGALLGLILGSAAVLFRASDVPRQ